MKHKVKFTLISRKCLKIAREASPSMVIQINTFPCKDRWIFGNFVVEKKKNSTQVYFLKSRISESFIETIV